MRQALRSRACAAFATELARGPGTSLRSGAALDVYDPPVPFDPVLDEPTDAYLESYTYAGQAFLDAASWRHYLGRWVDYAMRHTDDDPAMVLEGMLASLRPPDRDPPRLASLSTRAGGSDRGVPRVDSDWVRVGLTRRACPAGA